MPGAKIVVLYRATRFIFTMVTGAVGVEPPYHRVTEIHFASMNALQASASTTGTQEAAKHAISISSGGPPLFLIADEGTVVR